MEINFRVTPSPLSRDGTSMFTLTAKERNSCLRCYLLFGCCPITNMRKSFGQLSLPIRLPFILCNSELGGFITIPLEVKWGQLKECFLQTWRTPHVNRSVFVCKLNENWSVREGGPNTKPEQEQRMNIRRTVELWLVSWEKNGRRKEARGLTCLIHTPPQ